jgi:predicted deacylase
MESLQESKAAKKKFELKSVLRQTLIVAGALLLGYQLNYSSIELTPLVPDANANVVTIQAFPAIEPVATDTEAVQPVGAEASEPEIDELSDEPSLEVPLEVAPLIEQETVAVPSPAAVPLSELIPEQDLDGFSTDQVEAPELEYVAALSPGGAALPEGLETVESGTLSRLTWHAGESLYGSSVPTPVLVAQGKEEGPTLCLTAAVHGDEINGIETVRRMMYSINPDKLKGRVIGVPIVNIQAFERHSRYLPDRRDLNRFFPGNASGSSASRIAQSLFDQVIRHCNALVDLHTGSFHRTNLPQLRANLDVPEVVELTQGFGSTVILHSQGGDGTLRAAATRAGIPAVTLEAGEPLRIDDRAVKHSEKALFTLMNTMGMYKRPSLWGNPEPTYYSSLWIRANKGGMLIADAKLGRRVREGDVLGIVVDPITNDKQKLLAPASGRVIGMALDQFVMPGYAAFHLGIEAPSLDELENQPGEADFDHSVAQLQHEDERDDSE